MYTSPSITSSDYWNVLRGLGGSCPCSGAKEASTVGNPRCEGCGGNTGVTRALQRAREGHWELQRSLPRPLLLVHIQVRMLQHVLVQAEYFSYLHSS